MKKEKENNSEKKEPTSISFKQNLENRSNFNYLKPDQTMLENQRKDKKDIDDDLKQLLQ